MYKAKRNNLGTITAPTDCRNQLEGNGFTMYDFEVSSRTNYVTGAPVVSCSVSVTDNDIKRALVSVYDDKDATKILPLSKMIARVGLCKLVNRSGRVDYLNHYEDCTGALALFICETYQNYTSNDVIEITSATRRVIPADNDNGFIEETKSQPISIGGALFRQLSVYLSVNANKSINDARRVYKSDADLLGYDNGTIAGALMTRYGLTEKQSMIVALVLKGFSYSEIGLYYGNNYKTIQESCRGALKKIDDVYIVDMVNYKIAQNKRKSGRDTGRAVGSKFTHRDPVII